MRSWTHLERQRGGFGFLGGPGETQIEADRRDDRDARRPHRAGAGDGRHPPAPAAPDAQKGGAALVALVGYTNAGKSTLFNALTRRARSPTTGCSPRSTRRCGASICRTARRRPFRHGRLRRRPADDAGRRLPRDAGGGGRGRHHPARARHRPSRQRGAGARRRGACSPSSASMPARRSGSSRCGTRSTFSPPTGGRRRRSRRGQRSAAGAGRGGGVGADRRGAAASCLRSIEERIGGGRRDLRGRACRRGARRPPPALRDGRGAGPAPTEPTGPPWSRVRVPASRETRLHRAFPQRKPRRLTATAIFLLAGLPERLHLVEARLGRACGRRRRAPPRWRRSGGRT